ncbi:TetR/AcrR family transcriptional regulator [Paenibacillus elgii]|uniref:TetR/AcrR family transcriptional regulator n=1 Tax=Paenibacillus elgii TaxID=189691 RepID=UPI00203B32E1|nr:TetR/AcrR family transcriptional regulator [Paenibacillus elgii]MCM3271069.1 TetR/AcrR family transcriptional regulator [Paenibacillus elgii]
MDPRWKEQLEQHRNKRREDIIQGAQQLFLEQGLSLVTLKDVAEFCGISKVTLYKYFKSLDEIIFEVQINVLSAFGRVAYHSPSGDNGFEKMRRMLEHMISVSEHNAGSVRFIAMFDAFYRENYVNEELESRYISFLRRNTHPFYAILEEGISDGSVRSDIDINVLTFTLSNVVVASLQRMIVRGKLLHLDQGVEPAVILKQMTDMALTYIKPQGKQ